MLQRFLDPSVLASISGLELIAKTVVDGFVNGLHRSPDFGFSQEFAEYVAYNPGDDLRLVRVELAHRKSLDTRCQTRAEQREWPTALTTPLVRSESRREAALFDEELIPGLASGSEPPILRRKRTFPQANDKSVARRSAFAAVPRYRAPLCHLPLCRPIAQRRCAVMAPQLA